MQSLPEILRQLIRQQGLVLCLASVFGISLAVGCSGKSPPAGSPTAGQEEANKESGEPEGSSKPKGDGGSRGQAVAAASKRPMIGDIPLDVWLENPIGESKKTGNAAAAPAPDKVAEKPMEKAAPAPMPTPPADAPKASGGNDWAAVVSIEDLQEETKKIRLELQDYLSAIGKYNAHYKDDIVAEGAVLSAIAGIALVHPEKISWKEHAAHVRDIAAEMAKKSKGLGQKPFDETKKEFEKLDGLLSGNPPPDLPEAVADVPFSEVVSRRGIMKRLQASSDYLRANFQTEATLTKNQDDAAHAAAIVAALAKVIGTEGYPNADEDEYKGFSNGLMDANITMAKAARDKDFAAFSEANGKVIKFCNECHGAYQGSN